jgi:hypothetical protein
MSPSEEGIDFVASSNDGGAVIYSIIIDSLQAMQIENLRMSSKFIGAEGISVFTGGALAITSGSMLNIGWITIGSSLIAMVPIVIGMCVTGFEEQNPDDFLENKINK